jgi:hypothetical protein
MVTRKLQQVRRSRDDVTIEFENGLPTSLGDMYQSYQDDIIARDSPAATDTPVRILAALPCGILLLISAWSYV